MLNNFLSNIHFIAHQNEKPVLKQLSMCCIKMHNHVLKTASLIWEKEQINFPRNALEKEKYQCIFLGGLQTPEKIVSQYVPVSDLFNITHYDIIIVLWKNISHTGSHVFTLTQNVTSITNSPTRDLRYTLVIVKERTPTAHFVLSFSECFLLSLCREALRKSRQSCNLEVCASTLESIKVIAASSPKSFKWCKHFVVICSQRLATSAVF